MFCEKCGRPIPEGAERCAFCNPPAQQEAPEAEPAFQLNMPAEGVKQKKKGGKVALIAVALVLVVAIVVAAFNWSSVNRFFVRTFGEPVEYLQDVEADSAADSVKALTEAYDSYLASYNEKGAATDVTVTVEPGEALMTTLTTILSQSGMNLDLSWLESVTLAPQVELYESTLRMDILVGLNRTDLLTVSCIWDMESQTVLVGCPELHDSYIAFDAYDLFGYEADSTAEAMALSRQTAKAIIKYLPEGKELESLINKYIEVILGQLEEAEKETQKVKAGGLEQNLTVLTVELSQKDILKIAEAVLKKAEDDKELKSVLNDLSKAVNEMNALSGGYEVDLYDSFSYAVEEALDELDYIIDEAERSDFITIETFLDSKDAIVGRTLTVEADGEELELYYITVTEGKEFAFEAELSTVRIEGEGTVEKEKRTGSFTLTESGTEYLTVELEDFLCSDKGDLSGTVRLLPGAVLYEMMDMPASLSGLLGAVSVTFGSDSVCVAIESAGSELVSLTLSGHTSAPSPITLPDSFSVDDDNAGNRWLSELDLKGVVSNLKKAGLPSQYADIAEQFLEMFAEEFK